MFNHLIVNDGVLIHFISFAIFVDKEITFLHQFAGTSNNCAMLQSILVDLKPKPTPQTIFCEEEIPYNF